VAEAAERDRVRHVIEIAVREQVDGVIDTPDQSPSERPLGLPIKMDDGSPRPLDSPPPMPPSPPVAFRASSRPSKHTNLD
jgi:hypothetical protein